MAGVRQPGVLAWLYLMRVYDKLQLRSMQHLAEYNLTPAQFDVLAQLSLKDRISQQELAERLLVTKGNVCGLIDRMSSRGLVERQSHPHDARVNLICLTDKGQALADEVIPAEEAFMQSQMDALSSDEQRTLQALLRELDLSLRR
jgi:DNA-binding MarR family transcriptional regulator